MGFRMLIQSSILVKNPSHFIIFERNLMKKLLLISQRLNPHPMFVLLEKSIHSKCK
jgi:hypothetical protein